MVILYIDIETYGGDLVEMENYNGNLLKRLSYESKLKKLYEQIICLDDLEKSLEVLCESLTEIFNLKKLLIIEIDKSNFIFRKYLTKGNNKGKKLSRQEVYKEIENLMNNEKDFFIQEIKDKNTLKVCKKIKIKKYFNLVIVFEWLEGLVELDYFLDFIERFSEIIKSMYLKEFKYLALKKQSYTDGLTKCYNRSYFELKISELRKEENLAMIVLDLDCLKDINDKLGHDFGDKVIKKAVRVIKLTIDRKDIFCRYGGDEFVVISQNRTDKYMEELLKQIKRKFSEIDIDGFPLNVSMGYAIKEKKEDSIRECFKMADYRMYKKKIENKKISIEKLNKYIKEHKKSENKIV